VTKLENHFEVVDPVHTYTAIHKGQRDQLFKMSTKTGGDKS
jgi:hypothetical protein